MQNGDTLRGVFLCLNVNELNAKLHIMCDLAKLLNKKNCENYNQRDNPS